MLTSSGPSACIASFLLKKHQMFQTRLSLLIITFLALVLGLVPLSGAGASSAKKASSVSQAASPTGGVSIQAAGRGYPLINFSDGRPIASVYNASSAAASLLAQNLATPLALASGDFDEDGTPDLIGGYAAASGGIITLHRGNADTVYPNSAQAKQRRAAGTGVDFAFLPSAEIFEISQAADFLATGDFDGDSHLDVVTAKRGASALHLLSGDGRGELSAAKQIELTGTVTALVAGDVNRADGLTDLVVAITAKGGAKVLVFESPEGALRGRAEEIGLPAEATAIAVGELGGDNARDVAIAAGRELVVVYGRDRKLSSDEKLRAGVPKAKVVKRAFSFSVKAVVLGSFARLAADANPSQAHSGGGAAPSNKATASIAGRTKTSEVALLSDDGGVYLLSEAATKKKKASERVEKWKSQVLARGPWAQAAGMICARVSAVAADNLVVVDSANRKLHIIASGEGGVKPSGLQPVSLDVAGEPVAVLAMRLNRDALNDLVVLRRDQSAPSLLVTPAAVQATFVVNRTDDDPDFLPGDGLCDAGDGICTLRAAIQEANATTGADTIVFNIFVGAEIIQAAATIIPQTPLPVITDPVTIDGTTQPGFAGTPLIELDGSVAGGVGLDITAGNSVVRGLIINDFGIGISLSSNGSNVIEGNYIGTDRTGLEPVGNSANGVFIASANNLVGGTAASARNLISGNGLPGVFIGDPGGSATGNRVEGNFIGTNVSGTGSISNAEAGVLIGGFIIGPGTAASGSNNTVGGAAAGAGNLLSGNTAVGGSGVEILNPSSTGNLVQGNRIGTDASGAAALMNVFGVFTSGGSGGNLIGGTSPGARNIISGNSSIGVFLGSGGNTVQGNFIGTDVSGANDLGNLSRGVLVDSNASNNTIGGTTTGAGNLISGNDSQGIRILSGASAIIQGNFIGTNADGTAALGNSFEGVFTSTATNLIGGTTPEARNIISGNGLSGVAISGSGATGNLVQSNFIGTTADGSAALGNGGEGVLISAGASGNTVGGAAGNRIAFNAGAGVFVPSGTGNAILSNSIFSNGGLGIDLETNPDSGGVTPNDPGDADAGGNNLQNFPVLTSASSSEGGLTIQGILDSNPGTTYRIEFFSNASCDPSGNGEGQTFIGFTQVTTPGVVPASAGLKPQATATFTATLGVAVADGQVITATATDPGGNTSEFSNCVTVAEVEPEPEGIDLAISKTDSPDPVVVGALLTYTITVTNNGPGDAFAVTVVDSLPPGVQFVSASTSQGSCTHLSGVVTCSLGAIEAEASATATILIRPTQPGTITNIATVRAVDQSDTDSENNTATAITTVIQPDNDLSITKTATPNPVRPGDTITYRIVVTNLGTSFANDVIVTDNLPAQVTFVSCEAGSGICQGSGNNRSVLFPALSGNQSGVVTILATVNQGVADGTVITNTATVTATSRDTNAANNSSTATNNVQSQPLGITGCVNQTVTAPEGQGAAAVTFNPQPSATGNRPGAVVVCNPPTGSIFSVGPPTEVRCTATDSLGGSASCSFLVTVNPARQPVPVPDITVVIFPRVDVPDNSPDPERFTITNPGTVEIELMYVSLLRVTDAGRLTNLDDSDLYTVREIVNGQARELRPGDKVRIGPGETREFQAVFNPQVPEVAASAGGVPADDVLPDEVTSRLTFMQSGNPDTVITLVGRVERELKLIDPDNPAGAPELSFSRSGNEYILEYSVYDPNLNVTQARYELLDGSGQRVGQVQQVDLGAAIREVNLVRGQSFTVEQRFTGANSNPDVRSIRLTITDGEGSVSATVNLSSGASGAATIQSQAQARVKVMARRLELERP